MPWEVARTLLQVQWVPRESEAGNNKEDEEDEEDSDEGGDNPDHDSYFADPDATPTIPSSSPLPNTINISPLAQREEESEAQTLILPSHGVWPTIKRISRHSSEGYLALWKGLLTSSVTEMLASMVQPIIHGFLLPSPGLFPYHHQTSVFLPLTSHLLTGILLSPLDLIRTRLIVQPLRPSHSGVRSTVTYTGPINALHSIYTKEGGMRGLYTHPHLLIPTVLDNVLRPLVSLTFPQMILNHLGLGHVADDPENNRVLWGLAELGGSFLGLLVMLPVETVRRRLQVQLRLESEKERHQFDERDQSIGNGKGSKLCVASCVRLRPRPYHGVVDCLWRIVTEEKSDPFLRSRPQQRKRRRPSTSVRRPSTSQNDDFRLHAVEKGPLLPGLTQLYQGLSMRLGASIVVFILSVLGGGDGDGEGWAEL
ncbi:mitochondrial carrier [Marasmius fiardii PR-910]|nr:mitochondrial carrier [Marasmius fiardii PR-910]